MRKKIVMYLSNVIRSCNQVFWAVFAFKMLPRIYVSRADPTWMKLDRTTWNNIITHVLYRMKQEGITYDKFYLDDAFDCVEFARCFVDYFCQEMRRQNKSIKGQGIPIDAVSIQLKKRGGHCVIKVEVDGKVEYWEPYPEHFKRLMPDREELATARPVVTR